jgi:hypothetical protein
MSGKPDFDGDFGESQGREVFMEVSAKTIKPI